MYLRASKSKWQSDITIIILFLLSSGGLVLFSVERTAFTLFYFVSAIPIIKWILKRKRLSAFYIKLLLWAAVTIVISFFLISRTKLFSILHFGFYVIAGVSILNTCTINEKTIKSTAKFVIYLNLINILLAIALNSFGVSEQFTILGSYYNRDVIRYMGFTSEPSYLAMEISVCMIAILLLEKGEKHDWKILIAYIIAILLAQTTLGLMSIIFVGYTWFQTSSDKTKSTQRLALVVMLAVILILIVGIGIMLLTKGDFLSRLYLIFEAITKSHSLKELQTNIRLADGSAWYRIGPLLMALDEASLGSFYTWFGHGIGADGAYYTRLLNSETLIHGGFLQAGFYNQGFVGLITFLYMIIKKCRYMGKINIIYLLFCFCNCSISTQAFWFMLITYIKTSEILESKAV